MSNWQPQSTSTEFLSVNEEMHNRFLMNCSPSLDILVEKIYQRGFQPTKCGYAVYLSNDNLQKLIDSSSDEPTDCLDRLAILEQEIRYLFPRLRGQLVILLAQKNK